MEIESKVFDCAEKENQYRLKIWNALFDLCGELSNPLINLVEDFGLITTCKYIDPIVDAIKNVRTNIIDQIEKECNQ